MEQVLGTLQEKYEELHKKEERGKLLVEALGKYCDEIRLTWFPSGEATAYCEHEAEISDVLFWLPGEYEKFKSIGFEASTTRIKTIGKNEEFARRFNQLDVPYKYEGFIETVEGYREYILLEERKVGDITIYVYLTISLK